MIENKYSILLVGTISPNPTVFSTLIHNFIFLLIIDKILNTQQ